MATHLLTKPYYTSLMQSELPALRPAVDLILSLIPTNPSPTFEEVSPLNMALFALIKLASNSNHCTMIRYLDEIEQGHRVPLDPTYANGPSTLLAELGLAPKPIRRRA